MEIKLNDKFAEICQHKRRETEQRRAQTPLSELQSAAEAAPAPRPFADALRFNGAPRLIAEVKKASPSKGVLRADFRPVQIAREYEAAGADALSVLTDEHFFQGSLRYLTEIRAAVRLPILRKDFTLDEYHVWEARAAGADAVLLIAAALDDAQLRSLKRLTEQLGMTALIEVHDEAELERALSTEPRMIGVNNRNLRTFETTLETAFALRPRVPREIVFVSESGIHTRADMRLLEAHRVDAVLIGESLMRAESISEKVDELRGRGR